MAISFIGSAENSAANGADVTITLPGGMQQNDLVIVTYAIGDNDNLDLNMAMVTSGYTEIHDLLANDTSDCNLGVFYKFMPATPDSSAVVDGLGGTDAAVAAVCMVFRGVDTTTPFDVTSTSATGLNTMHPDPPSIDHNNPSGVWTVIAGASGQTIGGAETYTFPTGYTTNALDRGQADTTSVTVGMGYRTNPSDPEDPGVMTHSGTDSTGYCWCAVTMALRPDLAQTIAASAAIMTLSAPTSTLLAATTLAATAPLVAFSAPTATLNAGDQTVTANAATMILSAPASTLLAETTLLTTVPQLLFSAPSSTLLAETTLLTTAPTVTFTAPTAVLSLGGGVFNYYAGLAAIDQNSARRWALQDRYSVDNLDLVPLLARYLQEHTANDSTRAYTKLEDICRGLQPPDA
jgi:hypothetical protein